MTQSHRMNLGKWFADRIKKNADQYQPKGLVPFEIEAERESFVLSIKLEAVDQLSCKLTELTVTRPHKKGANPRQFNAIVLDLSEKLTYLQESIVLIEKDDQSERAMLRSANPLAEEAKITYFEMLVDPGVAANLKRISRTGTEKNEIAFVMGFDLLQRLVNDISGVIAHHLTHPPEVAGA